MKKQIRYPDPNVAAHAVLSSIIKKHDPKPTDKKKIVGKKKTKSVN